MMFQSNSGEEMFYLFKSIPEVNKQLFDILEPDIAVHQQFSIFSCGL
jgi:hypothetical protein